MKKKATVKKISKPSSKVSSRKKTSAIKAKRKSSKTSSPLRRTLSDGKNKKTKKAATKQATNRIRTRTGTKSKASVIYKTSQKISQGHRIVRIMGQGQFTVDNSTLKRLNEIDDSIVQLVSKERSDDVEFKKQLTELTDIVEAKGKPLDPKEIIQSDIILPSPDLSVDEAKRLFRGEGVIPETEV
jgi:hypothetical protein